MFQIRNISVAAYCNGWTQWSYRTTGAIAPCLRPGFFNDAVDMLTHGDLMAIAGADGLALRCVTIGNKSGKSEVILLPLL